MRCELLVVRVSVLGIIGARVFGLGFEYTVKARYKRAYEQYSHASGCEVLFFVNRKQIAGLSVGLVPSPGASHCSLVFLCLSVGRYSPVLSITELPTAVGPQKRVIICPALARGSLVLGYRGLPTNAW